jgi:FkbM family methyltransferase
MIILDVGANEGQSALAFRGKYPEAIIHSFEPIKSTFSELKINTAKDKRIICHNYALGAVNEEVVVNIQKFSQTNSLTGSVNIPIPGCIKESVQVRRLSDVCAEIDLSKIDLLKTDTEGFDVNVLKGGESLLENFGIKMVLTEVGLRPDDPRHTPLSCMMNYLELYNFYLFGLYDIPMFGVGRDLEYCNALFTLASDK